MAKSHVNHITVASVGLSLFKRLALSLRAEGTKALKIGESDGSDGLLRRSGFSSWVNAPPGASSSSFHLVAPAAGRVHSNEHAGGHLNMFSTTKNPPRPRTKDRAPPTTRHHSKFARRRPLAAKTFVAKCQRFRFNSATTLG
jgi:hypothetical protein